MNRQAQKIQNPETGCMITIGGRVYNDLVRRRVIAPVGTPMTPLPTTFEGIPIPTPIQREPELPPLAQLPTGRNYLGTLVQDINKEIFMLLNPNELDKYCSSDEKIQRLCENDKFIEEYLRARGYDWLLQPLILHDTRTEGRLYDDPTINYVIDTTIPVGDIPEKLNVNNRSDTLIRFLLRRYSTSPDPLERERALKLLDDLFVNFTDWREGLNYFIDLARNIPEIRDQISYFAGLRGNTLLIEALGRPGYLQIKPLILGLLLFPISWWNMRDR